MRAGLCDQVAGGLDVAGSTAFQLDVAARLDHIWSARAEGHEIASHTCGHFDGKDWSREDWLAEFKAFDRVMLGAWKDNGLAEQDNRMGYALPEPGRITDNAIKTDRRKQDEEVAHVCGFRKELSAARRRASPASSGDRPKRNQSGR